MSELYIQFKAPCHIGDNNEMQKYSPSRRSKGTGSSFLESHCRKSLQAAKSPNHSISLLARSAGLP